MKPLKLIPIKTNNPKSVYTVVVKFMHGDADLYTFAHYRCEWEQDLRRIVAQLKNPPRNPAEGGDEDTYDKWEVDTFKSDDFIPTDKTGYDCKASYDGHECFYNDENGVKFKVEIPD
jgi:hypothetical protein